MNVSEPVTSHPASGFGPLQTSWNPIQATNPRQSVATDLGFFRHNDLWFSNDTLVIKAEKKVFRVTQSILAARSSVFSGMVTFPQPSSGEAPTTADGSPVVYLHDSAADVEVFLRAIFDSRYVKVRSLGSLSLLPTSYFMPPPAPIELENVLGILRLSHKYNVQYLHLRALQYLSIPFGPACLDDYLIPRTKDHLRLYRNRRCLPQGH